MRSALLVVAVLLAAPSAAEAQMDERAARAHFEAASSYYDQGRYEEALHEFEEALRAAPDAQKGLMVFNIGQAQERLGRLAEAIESFQRYLELEPAAPDRAAIEARLSNLRARLGETGIVLRVSEDGARVSVDGSASGTTPLAEPLRVAPGRHEILIERDGFRPFRLTVSVEAGRQVEAEATLVAQERHADPVRAPRPAPPPPPSGRLWTWIGAGATGAALAGGIVLGVLALGASDASNAEVTGSREVYEDELSSAETLALFADISFGAAVLAAGATVVLFIVEGRPAERSTAALQLVPASIAGGAGARLQGRF
ncbi:MAG: tetratricopeptide repeat protein [Deltaproteobacteria bacterium]|nr:tetratricopeptide repeat protein [Deltaproteobacteria bacterium]